MFVYTTEFMMIRAYSTPRKALEAVIRDGGWEVYNPETEENEEFTEKMVKKAITWVNKRGYVSFYQTGTQDSETVSRVRVQ